MNLLFLLPAALANGQTTHMWISQEAIEVLPEGELRDFLSEPSHLAALKNGTMFPDGGYAVDHPYGETAHWEPFQGLFRDWILDNFEGPMDPEAGASVAFYLGMASHGMADQVFDSLYMERSKQMDAEQGWALGESLDTSSDIVWASITGKQTPPPAWYPPVLVSLFEEVGIEVSEETLTTGQNRLGLAIDLVGNLGTNPEGVQVHADLFPWGCANLHDRSVPGAPYSEAQIIADYWTALWNELKDESVPLEVLASFPSNGGMDHHRASEEVESRLTLVFNRSLLKSEVSEIQYAITSESETPELEPWLFYNNDSHVVHLIPQSDWSENSDYQLELTAGLTATDGRVLTENELVNFSTKPLLDPADAECTCSTNPKAGSFHYAIGLIGLTALRRKRIKRS